MPYTNKRKFDPEQNGKYSDLKDLGPFDKGINNRKNAYSLDTDELLDAVNVDIDNQGKIRRRQGYTKLVTGDSNSVFGFKGLGYVVINGTLKRFDPVANTYTDIANGLTSPISYVVVNNEIYWSDGISRQGKINLYGNPEEWAIASPKASPVVTMLPNQGALQAGRYSISYTYLYGNYETGGSPEYVVDVPVNNFAFQVTASGSEQATGANIYITPLNAQEPLFFASGNTATITNVNNLGHKMFKRVHDAFPPCQNLGFSNGRIFGTSGTNLYWTSAEAADYRQYHTQKGWLNIDNSNIQIAIPMRGGVYIATEYFTYFLEGTNPDEWDKQHSKFPFTGIAGTGFQDEDKQVCGWLAPSGYITADEHGNVTNNTVDTIDFPKGYRQGASLFRKQKTIKQVIFSMQNKEGTTTFNSQGYDELISQDGI